MGALAASGEHLGADDHHDARADDRIDPLDVEERQRAPDRHADGERDDRDPTRRTDDAARRASRP